MAQSLGALQRLQGYSAQSLGLYEWWPSLWAPAPLFTGRVRCAPVFRFFSLQLASGVSARGLHDSGQDSKTAMRAAGIRWPRIVLSLDT